MTNVSKNKLQSKDSNNIYNQFAIVIAKLDANNSSTFLNCLLTNSEQIMLTKRLTAILMIHHGYSTYKVWTLLKISSSTAKQYKLQYDQGKFNALLRELYKPKNSFFKDLESFLDDVIAPMGKDRWRYLKRR